MSVILPSWLSDDDIPKTLESEKSFARHKFRNDKKKVIDFQISDYESVIFDLKNQHKLISQKLSKKDFIIPLSSQINWGDITGNLTSQTDLQIALDDVLAIALAGL